MMTTNPVTLGFAAIPEGDGGQELLGFSIHCEGSLLSMITFSGIENLVLKAAISYQVNTVCVHTSSFCFKMVFVYYR